MRAIMMRFDPLNGGRLMKIRGRYWSQRYEHGNFIYDRQMDPGQAAALECVCCRYR